MKVSGLMGPFGGMCFYCRRAVSVPSYLPGQALTAHHATVDHDIPKCRIGYITPMKNNLVLACRECNNLKGDMTGTEFIQFRRDKKFARSYVEFLEMRLAKRLRLP